jgi:hypothetical protein
MEIILASGHRINRWLDTYVGYRFRHLRDSASHDVHYLKVA